MWLINIIIRRRVFLVSQYNLILITKPEQSRDQTLKNTDNWTQTRPTWNEEKSLKICKNEVSLASCIMTGD